MADKSENLAKARKAKAEKQAKTRRRAATKLDQEVNHILDTHPDPELCRKLAYAHQHITHPGMPDVVTALLREARREAR